MSDPYPPSQTRIYLNAPPFLRSFGCSGCGLGCGGVLLGIFVLGGSVGLLLSGWRTLLGFVGY